MRHRHRSGGFVAGILLTFGSVGLVGCATYGNNQGSEQCAAKVENPHISDGERKKGHIWIVSKLRFGCDPLPQQHSITIYNERQGSDGVWRWYSKQTYGQPDGPGVETTRYGTYQGCLTGKWRAHFIANGVSTTGIPFGPVGDFSGEQTISTCA